MEETTIDKLETDMAAVLEISHTCWVHACMRVCAHAHMGAYTLAWLLVGQDDHATAIHMLPRHIYTRDYAPFRQRVSRAHRLGSTVMTGPA